MFSTSRVSFLKLTSGVLKRFQNQHRKIPHAYSSMFVKVSGFKHGLIAQTRCFSQGSMDELLWLRATQYGQRTAIIDHNGTFTYDDLLTKSFSLSQEIDKTLGSATSIQNIVGPRVSFLCPNNVSYTAIQWAIWRSGGIAVPLCKVHPVPELEYFIKDSQSSLVIATDEYFDQISSLADKIGISCLRFPGMDPGQEISPAGTQLTVLEKTLDADDWDARGAMLLYTSGTTGRPKGVLMSHSNVRSQITTLIKAWGWMKDDVILHVLPLHHTHGVINVLACPLWTGATCIMLPAFHPKQVWQFLMGEKEPQISLFMAVPTVYAMLTQHWKNAGWDKDSNMRDKIKENCQKLRLMVSGSAALPQPVMEQWEDITGHILLERYGMTEIGMALSNPLNGTRTPGCVGNPLPGVQCRIVTVGDDDKVKPNQVVCEGDENTTQVVPGMEEQSGELQTKGPSVFQRYWNKPEATSGAFTDDGWFKTEDVCVYKDGVYKILGRPVDIIKHKGYKISALDVERKLLTHEDIVDCAVVGLDDLVCGQQVAALLVCSDNKTLTVEEIKSWAKEILPHYEVPTLVKCLDVMPRNAMGKVNKKELLKLFDK